MKYWWKKTTDKQIEIDQNIEQLEFDNDNLDQSIKTLNETQTTTPNTTTFIKNTITDDIPKKTKIFTPLKFSDVRVIADALLNEKLVVVDIKGLDKITAKRFKDFIAGVVYAKNGEYIKLDDNLFKFIVRKN